MADQSSDTGTGGININGEAYDMDVGLDDSQGGSQGAWSPGDVSVDNSVKDITKPTRETFARFMSKTTLATAGSSPHPNAYPVGAGDASDVVESALKTTAGFPSPLGATYNEAKFSPSLNSTMGANGLPIKKGLAPGSDPDGNTLLPLAAPPADPAASSFNYIKTTAAPYQNEPIKTFTLNSLKQNLNGPAIVPQQALVVIGDGGDVAPTAYRSLELANNPEGKGTSHYILQPEPSSVVTELAAAKIAPTATVDNFYPVGAGQNTPTTFLKIKSATPQTSVNPAPSDNEEKYSPDVDSTMGAAGTTSSIFSKGKSPPAPGVAWTGNELLTAAAEPAPAGGEYVKPSGAVDEKITTWTKGVLDPNLHSPLDPNPTPNVVMGDGGLVPPQNVRDLVVTVDLATDGGTSNKVMQPAPDHVVGLADRVALVPELTAQNYYRVTPNSPPEVSLFNLDSSAVLSDPNNEKFAEVNIGSPLVVSKGKIIATNSASEELPGGNNLLPGAASLPIGSVSDEFIKLDAVLNEPIASYTKNLLDANKENPLADNPPINPIESGSDAWPLRVTTTLAEDGGTSSNVLTTAPDAAHELLENEAIKVAAVVTNGEGVLGGIPNKFALDGSPQNFSPNDPATGYPASPSEAQSNPSNSSYYTKGKLFPSTYSTSATNLNIKRGKAPGDAPDGNELLIDATAISADAPLAGPQLQNPIKDFTADVLSKNLYQPTQGGPGNAEQGEFYGPKSVFDTNAQADSGTFENIRKNPESRALTRAEMQAYVALQQTGQVNALGVANENRTTEKVLNPDLYKLSVEGYPRSPTAEQKSETDAGFYAPGGEVPTSYSDAATKSNLNTSIRRGKAPGDAPNGNKLLKDAASPAPPPASSNEPYVKPAQELKGPVKDYVSAVLKKNRFSSSNKFWNSDSKGSSVQDKEENMPEFTEKNNAYMAPDQLRFGVSPGNDDESKRSYNFRRLARVGTILQMRSTLEVQALANESTDPYDIGTDILAVTVPGLGQLGAGVPLPTALLDVNNIINNLPEDAGQDVKIHNEQLLDIGTTFEGTINNAFEKFSGFTALGMQSTAAVLVPVVVGAIGVVLGAAFGAASASRVPGAIRTPQGSDDLEGMLAARAGKDASGRIGTGNGRPGLGAFSRPTTLSSADDIITAFLPTSDGTVFFNACGINPTVNSFSDAAREGALAFFGLSKNILKAAESPGFNVVVARAIIRSVSALVLSFIELGKIIATGNVGGAIEKTLEIFQNLKNSRFMKVLNIFAQLGDKAISSNDVAFNRVVKLDIDAGEKHSKIDSILDFEKNAAYSKSRLQGRDVNGGETLKLAWSANRSPDFFMIPKTALILGQEPTLAGGTLVTTDPYQKTRFIQSDGLNPRISSDDVEKIENAFDSEYVPFYFQDLRTNEILSFHAFLSALSEDYSASYEQSTGFGRIDPVKIYSGTTRKISLSFVVAALDKSDFSSMWLKINKLLTLVYPQFTAGRKINSENSNGARSGFRKPFSQLIGAAPMVRMRIGDLITSNYSKFNLAGIFGLTTPGAQIEGESIDDVDVADISKILRRKPQVDDEYLLSENKRYSTIDGNEIDTSIGGGVLVRVVESTESGAYVEIRKVNNVDAFDLFTIDQNGEIDFSKSPIIGAKIFVPQEVLTPENAMPETLGKIKSYENTRWGTYTKAASNFMSEENNVIAKSFKSTGGRGLPGFIESIGFDWLAGTWEIEEGKKAPKMARVTLSFSPIHDITPGLDATGYNRAPIYQLGPYGRAKRG